MIKEKLQNIVFKRYNKEISNCTNEELYYSILELVKKEAKERPIIKNNKKVYYVSAEFLIGKLLSNNLINLGIYEEIKKILKENKKNLTDIEEIEPEPSLGNGGLGRLASCFLDSIASIGLSGDGIGLNYHFGLFKQKFEDNLQKEYKNEWIENESWLEKTDTTFDINFGNKKVVSRMYDIDIIGYDEGINKLHLFDLETVDESIVLEGINFDKENIEKNITLFLYPDDSDEAGHLLRIFQQYFMVSSGAQYILKEEKLKGHKLEELYKNVTIQINDTHPTLIIPELIYLLMQEGIRLKEAINIVSKTCAYTNHTILAEALEKWPIKYLYKVVPHLMPIIESLNMIVCEKYDDPKVYIIDEDERVRMAHIDIHFGYSVNGVAKLHTDILKNSELNHFYKIYPEKFNNKTNGITFRRWLLHCNNELSDYITSLIGNEYKKDATKLEKLLDFVDDTNVINKIGEIKNIKKKQLKEYIKLTQNIDIDENSIFDIQIKRLHEYKRQQMNALYIVYKYLEIKKGNIPTKPITFIFGAKAAPAYIIAKDIIHFILCMQEIIEKDEEVSKYIKIVFIENYNVSKAEKLIPGCDISEQISLASKEASGTGNMKFMLNGALTLGTLDGANVEICELVGEENIYIFGEKSEAVINHYKNKDYISKDYYEKSPIIKEVVDFIINEKVLSVGRKENLERLYNEILNKDWFMTLLDIEDYIKTKDKALEDYNNREKWLKSSLINIAKAGFFSSDRTIEEYNKDIWKLK
ncbi:glycogen/starch/alpha-glucan phosphorylase [[Clostridium] colinum]|uniref:glycogen/starch/alpha-glucan phosphorylase n=1 Tax=[Clostridium] colinum TaxID=36835 RepID=UPI0020250FA3|nr:glycogen/starch/alpha-glucan phosphorylase [[Clostridium] colinum]